MHTSDSMLQRHPARHALAPGRVACPGCDLLLEIDALSDGSRANCPRCNHTLTRNIHDGYNKALAYSVSGLIFLVLAAQFNSFRDPFVVLLAVPLSIFGAMVPIALGFATLNIYTQIGLLTLIGLISKHGILIVEFANKLALQGASRYDAIRESSALRLRPILMTTFATVLGVWPLVIATGPGANSRFSIGLMITAGMMVGTLFTLFVIPAVYLMVQGRETAGAIAAVVGEETPTPEDSTALDLQGNTSV